MLATERGTAPALATTIGRLHRALRKRVRDQLPGPTLPQSQIEVVRLLHQQPGLRVQEVAATLGLAPNTASTLVQQLLRLGYIERQVDGKDRRSARLSLTEQARDRLAYWRDSRAAVLTKAIAALPTAESDLILAAVPALERLTEALEAPTL